MSESARFAYAQARVQARHGARPDEALWRRLQSNGELGSYIQAVQRTRLREWVLGMHPSQSSHELELALRRRFRGYVDEVAHWLPGRWFATVQWARRLPDLPALQHLLAGEAVLPWMLEDAELRPFASENLSQRLEALRDSDCAELVAAWQQDRPLHEGWLAAWKRRWPRAPGRVEGLLHLSRLLGRHFHALRAESGSDTERERARLEQQLVGALRRHGFQPAAACAHLGLVALDLERLRRELAVRALFETSPGVAA